MPNYTGNLNLAKPIPNEDSADIRVINENMDKIDEWSTEINKKTKGATSEAAGIVKYGTDVSTALEGSKLAEILGIEYGGVLNNNNQKVAGKGYYDTANKKIYKCTVNTSINYADAGYFIEVSNNDLLSKLQNLSTITAHSNELVSIKRSDGTITYIGRCTTPVSGSAIVKLPIPLVFFNNMKQTGVTATNAQSQIEDQNLIFAVNFFVLDETTIKFNATQPTGSTVVAFTVNGFWKNPIIQI